jgi:hypothetical protein
MAYTVFMCFFSAYIVSHLQETQLTDFEQKDSFSNRSINTLKNRMTQNNKENDILFIYFFIKNNEFIYFE